MEGIQFFVPGKPASQGSFTPMYNKQTGKSYLKATSNAHATITAMELLPSCVEIVRTYHDPSWH